jgi:putative phosphoribosyl transferase
MPFADRSDAGRTLARKLERFRPEHPIVLGLARGGVVVAAEIAAALAEPLDVLVVRKIGLPAHPELAIGALAGSTLWLNEPLISNLGVPQATVDRVIAEEQAEAARQEALYRLGRPPLPVAGRTLVVVDDGLATGATAVAGLRALRQRRPARIVFAVPVCSYEGAEQIGREADEVVCPWLPSDFVAVSQAYESFPQVSDQTVQRLLHEALTPVNQLEGAHHASQGSGMRDDDR